MVGPGRAGGSILVASQAAGHRIAGVLSRRPTPFGPLVGWDTPLPPCDLVVVAVQDNALAEVAATLSPLAGSAGAAIHLSGLAPVGVLAPLAAAGVATGSLHPLQTLPDAATGARSLAGSWAALTAPPDLAALLSRFADSLGMRPFPLADDVKPTYHAGASAASNYVAVALGVANELLQVAGAPRQAVEPLTKRVVENAFARGDEALTGPLARGDLGTVAGQMAAAAAVSPALGRQFRLLTEAAAARTGRNLPQP